MARATPPPLPGSTAPWSVLYCDCGPATRQLSGTRWLSPDEIAQGVRRALGRLPEPPRWIALSGSGDPSRHPRFGVVIDRVLAARDALAPSAGVAVLSSSSSVVVPSLREALRRVDARTFEEWRPLVEQAAPSRVQIYSVYAVPRERLEEIAGALRDALPDAVVDVV